MRKGFTLVELMIVIAIIILIASIAVPQYMQYIGRAQLATIQSDMQTLQKALAIYIQDWGSYPVQTNEETVINNGAIQTGTVLYNELTAQSGATVNTSSSTTITGLKGGKVYLDPGQFTAIVNHVGKTGTMTYKSDGSTYTITVTTKIAGASVTITVTPSSITQTGM